MPKTLTIDETRHAATLTRKVRYLESRILGGAQRPAGRLYDEAEIEAIAFVFKLLGWPLELAELPKDDGIPTAMKPPPSPTHGLARRHSSCTPC